LANLSVNAILITFMKKITKEQVEELAKLARIGLTDDEKESLSKEMTTVLDYVQMLDEVETKNIHPTSQVTGLKNVLRDDKIKQSDISITERLKNAPDKENTSIKVRKVFE